MLKISFIRFWHWNRRLSWPVGQWKSEGTLGRILKVEKKVRKRVVRIEKKNARPYTESRKESEESKNRKKNLTWAPVIVWKRKNLSPFRSSLECSHKMEMKYSDNGTLSPLVHCSSDRWTIAYGTQLTTFNVWKFFLFENIFDNCFVTICHFLFQNIFDNFCHFWFENMFHNCFVISVICLLIFTNHASFRDKICLWNILSSFRDSRGLRPRTPRRGFTPGPPPFAPPVLPPPSRPPPRASNN